MVISNVAHSARQTPHRETDGGFCASGAQNSSRAAMVGTPFKPGQSGNPGGRPKGLAAKARELGDRALEVIREALEDDDRKVRLAAAREVFDRGWGKPVQMTADVTKRLDEWTDDDLDAGISALRASLGNVVDAGDGTGETTKH